MTASPYASDAKIAEALAVIEAENVGTREQTILQQIFVACAMGGITPTAPPVPQNLRLAAIQNPESITVEWDALIENPDYEVEVYTPDDVWVSLGGTMGGITKEYGTSDGMVFGATYSFRVRSTFDFVTFSNWSTPLYGVVAPLQTLYYINQGSGLWSDLDNWFEDQAGTTPHGAIPTASDNCEINESNTVDEVPSSGYNSVTNYGTVSNNNGTIVASDGTVENNSGTVTINFNTVTTNDSGGIVENNYTSGTVTTNDGTVTYSSGTITTNNGTVTENAGTVTTNASGGTVTTNTSDGTVTTNANGGTVTTNASAGTIIANEGTVTTNEGTITTNESGGTIPTNGGPVSYNYGTILSNSAALAINYNAVTTNEIGGTISNNSGTVTTNYGTIEINSGGYYITDNYGTVTQNCGFIVNDYGYAGTCI
jgi:hypothetical protein